MKPHKLLPGRALGRRAGFSLLELMIALVILSAAFTIVWNTFTATTNAWRRGSKLMDRLHRGDFIMEQLYTALRSTAFFESRPEKYGFWLKDAGSGHTAHDTISWVTSGTAFVPEDSPLARGLHRIAFTIEDNDNGDPAVAVRAYPHLADLEEDDYDAETWYLSTEVQGFDCEVYDVEQEDWSFEWEDTNAIPRLVKVTLYLTPVELYEPPVEIVRLVEIPVAPPLEEAVEGGVVESGGGGTATETGGGQNVSGGSLGGNNAGGGAAP